MARKRGTKIKKKREQLFEKGGKVSGKRVWYPIFLELGDSGERKDESCKAGQKAENDRIWRKNGGCLKGERKKRAHKGQ